MLQKIFKVLILTGTLLFSFSAGTAVFAKEKTIDYKKEFPPHLVSAIIDGKIDTNGDGRLSKVEKNQVNSLTVEHKEEEAIYYSLSKIREFKNLKRLRLNCRVKNLRPLYALRRLRVLELGAYATVENGKTDFSQMKRLRELRSENETFSKKIDLSKNKKLKVVKLPEYVKDFITVYLPHKKMRLEGMTSSSYVIKFGSGNKSIQADIYLKQVVKYVNVSCENQELKAQDEMQMLELLKDKNYRIDACDLVSNRSGKLLRETIKNKTLKWTCSGNGATVKKGKICFTKAGEYTLFGYTKKKVFVIPVLVIDRTKF